jgi:hypothetical protein
MLKNMFAVSGKALLPLALFGAIFFSLTRTPVSQTTRDANRLHIQVHQLPTRLQDRIILRCDDALLSGPNSAEDVTCYIKNNGSKPIVAGALAIVYLLDDNGKTTSLPALLSFDSLLQPNFLAEHPSGLIAVGSEYRLQNLATDLDRPIKGIVALLDYIEFSDNTKTGPDRGGSERINAQRSGARKYSEWLVKKYDKTRSVESIAALLSNDDDVPSELGITDSNEAQGARIFKRQERRIYETKGADVLLKHIKPMK